MVAVFLCLFWLSLLEHQWFEPLCVVANRSKHLKLSDMANRAPRTIVRPTTWVDLSPGGQGVRGCQKALFLHEAPNLVPRAVM